MLAAACHLLNQVDGKGWLPHFAGSGNLPPRAELSSQEQQEPPAVLALAFSPLGSLGPLPLTLCVTQWTSRFSHVPP